MSYKKVKLKSLNKSDDLVIDDDVKREEELNFDCNSIVTVKHKKKRKYQISENGQDLVSFLNLYLIFCKKFNI